MNDHISPATRRTMRALGEDLSVARRRRRITQADLAGRMGVSVGTVKRLEAGDPGVGIGSLAMALLAFGKLDRLANLLPEDQDDIGQLIDRQHLPRRVRKPRRRDGDSQSADPDAPDGALF